MFKVIPSLNEKKENQPNGMFHDGMANKVIVRQFNCNFSTITGITKNSIRLATRETCNSPTSHM